MLLTILVLLVAALALFVLAERVARYELERHEQRRSVPRVVNTWPADGDQAVPSGTSLRVDLFAPTVGRGVDAGSLARGVRLVRLADGQHVPVACTIAADGGSISLTPLAALTAGERFRLEVTRELRDETGQPFIPHAATFTVAAKASRHIDSTLVGAELPIAYEQVPLTDSIAPSMFTALALGPAIAGDGGGPGPTVDLFAATADGRIFRYALMPDGSLRQRQVLTAVPEHNGGPRLITGLAFDPAEPEVLWVSHGVAQLSGAADFTGKLSTLSGDRYASYADRVVGLPRAFKDHLNFGIAFGPGDGMLYLSQGSNTSAGAPDTKWNNRPERLLSAAILRIDPSALPPDRPLDVRTPDGGGSYNPRAPGAPLTIHAIGVRSGYALLWHSSGRLFTAINGAGRGGNTPGILDDGGNVIDGPVMAVPVTTDDTLADVTRPDGYHGHPNPLRGERVLMGGNPTHAEDACEVSAYPVGTRPDPRFVRPAFNFGKGYSANGLAESNADVFGGTLRGAILVARFSAGDDVLILRTSPSGDVLEALMGIEGLTGLGSPLAILEDPNSGNIYVAEFDTQRLVLLRPIPGGRSHHVQRYAPQSLVTTQEP